MIAHCSACDEERRRADIRREDSVKQRAKDVRDLRRAAEILRRLDYGILAETVDDVALAEEARA